MSGAGSVLIIDVWSPQYGQTGVRSAPLVRQMDPRSLNDCWPIAFIRCLLKPTIIPVKVTVRPDTRYLLFDVP